jgi:hypothetical protein
VGNVMVWAIEAPGVEIMRTGGAAEVGLPGASGREMERMVPSQRVVAGEFGRSVIGEAPDEGVMTREDTEGVGVGKVIICAADPERELMIKTVPRAKAEGAEAGFVDEREMERMVPSGRVMAEEPGRRVTGETPGEGVMTREEAAGWRIMRELPTVAMTGGAVGIASALGGVCGVEIELGESWMVVPALAGSPFVKEAVGATTSWLPPVASETSELESVIAGPPGDIVWLLMTYTDEEANGEYMFVPRVMTGRGASMAVIAEYGIEICVDIIGGVDTRGSSPWTTVGVCAWLFDPADPEGGWGGKREVGRSEGGGWATDLPSGEAVACWVNLVAWLCAIEAKDAALSPVGSELVSVWVWAGVAGSAKDGGSADAAGVCDAGKSTASFDVPSKESTAVIVFGGGFTIVVTVRVNGMRIVVEMPGRVRFEVRVIVVTWQVLLLLPGNEDGALIWRVGYVVVRSAVRVFWVVWVVWVVWVAKVGSLDVRVRVTISVVGTVIVTVTVLASVTVTIEVTYAVPEQSPMLPGRMVASAVDVKASDESTVVAFAAKPGAAIKVNYCWVHHLSEKIYR